MYEMRVLVTGGRHPDGQVEVKENIGITVGSSISAMIFRVTLPPSVSASARGTLFLRFFLRPRATLVSLGLPDLLSLSPLRGFISGSLARLRANRCLLILRPLTARPTPLPRRFTAWRAGVVTRVLVEPISRLFEIVDQHDNRRPQAAPREQPQKPRIYLL